MVIEDFCKADNLMIDCSLMAGGVPIFRADVAGAGALYRDLGGFVACLDAIALRLAGQPLYRASA